MLIKGWDATGGLGLISVELAQVSTLYNIQSISRDDMASLWQLLRPDLPLLLLVKLDQVVLQLGDLLIPLLDDLEQALVVGFELLHPLADLGVDELSLLGRLLFPLAQELD